PPPIAIPSRAAWTVEPDAAPSVQIARQKRANLLHRYQSEAFVDAAEPHDGVDAAFPATGIRVATAPFETPQQRADRLRRAEEDKVLEERRRAAALKHFVPELATKPTPMPLVLDFPDEFQEPAFVAPPPAPAAATAPPPAPPAAAIVPPPALSTEPAVEAIQVDGDVAPVDEPVVLRVEPLSDEEKHSFLR